MFYNERHDAILEILESRNNVTVHYLAKALFSSEPTIRRDLTKLEKRGLIKRTFGGAILTKTLNTEIPLSLREHENIEAKDMIVKKAASLIRDGQVLFLDASSTVSYIVPYLSSFSSLTVVTNSPKTSLKLAEQKIKVFCTGGLLLENSIAYVGTYAENFVKNFNADLLFFSCRGISEDGILTDSSTEETDLRRVMMKQSEKNIFLCTSDKIGKKYMYNLCDISQIDSIISNADLPKSLSKK